MSGPAASRIPCLDGLRALSIGAVIFAHLCGTRHFLSEEVGHLFELGELGVRVFFVISGFLITTLLLEEHKKTGTVSIKGFYIRRTYRIFPAFYAFLLVVVLIDWLRPTLHSGDVLAAATYTMNYHQQSSWWVGHLWSLSVEEQFYLLWPAALLLFGVRAGLRGCVAVLLLAPLIRIVIWFWWPAGREGLGHTFPTIADALATGCLLAGARDWLWTKPWYVRALSSPAFALVPLLAMATNLLARSPRFHYSVGHSVINLAIALTIDRCVRLPEGAVGRFLQSRPLVWVGVLSYSLYLWQQLFLDRASDAWPHVFPLNVLLAFACASVSYYWVEQPFLRLRVRRAAAAKARARAAVAGAPSDH